MILKAWQRLQAMAFSRSKCEERITALSQPIVDHLIKIKLFDDRANFDKHCHDVNSWIRQVYSLESKGGKLTTQDYYTWLWGEKKIAKSEAAFEKWCAQLAKSYPLPQLTTPELLSVELTALYKRLATDLASGDLPDISDYL